jgi:hypothetical protein
MNSITTLRIVLILGVFQGIVALAIFLSCRCFNGFKPVARVTKSPAFRKFFKYHCYFWWLFLVSVAVHVFLAISLTGNPFQ